MCPENCSVFYYMVEKQSSTADKVLDEIAVIQHIEDMCNETFSNLLLRNMANMHTILDKVNSECNDQCFNAHATYRSCSSAAYNKFIITAVTMKIIRVKYMKIHYKETSRVSIW